MSWNENFLQRRLDAAQQQLDAANKIMERHVRALSQAHAALLTAKTALEWYGAREFESEGVTVGDRIDDALHELTH
jgi:hypothetical protein